MCFKKKKSKMGRIYAAPPVNKDPAQFKAIYAGPEVMNRILNGEKNAQQYPLNNAIVICPTCGIESNGGKYCESCGAPLEMNTEKT